MKMIAAVIVIILAIILYMIVCKIICWMFDFDKRTDRKWFNAELEDYDNDKRCAVASVTIVFIVITVGVLVWIFTC